MSHEFTSFIQKSSFKLPIPSPLVTAHFFFHSSFTLVYFVSYIYAVVKDGKKFFSNKTTRELYCLQLIQLFSPCIFFSPFTPSKYFAQFKIGLLTIGGERSENKRGANISNVYIGNHVNIYGCKLFVHLYHSCGLILNSWIV